MVAVLKLPPLTCAVLAALLVVDSIASDRALSPSKEIRVGLHRNDPGASAGHTLFGTRAGPVFLIDNAGYVVHRWELPEHIYFPGAELLPNGDLMVILEDAGAGCGLPFGGDIAWMRPDGEVVWRHAPGCVHHDHVLLPSGNVLLLLNSIKSREEVVRAGADPALVGPDGLVVDHLVEIRPEPPSGGEVVWRWSPWDHLVQDFDPAKPNYGRPAEHPGRIDLNFLLERLERAEKVERGMWKDWLHANAIDYHAEAAHVLFLARNFGELWVVDHSTTAEESLGRSGGRHGRGGDLLWRWGNPRAHGAGTVADQLLFWPHAAHWIPAGLPGAGNILLFNNGDEFDGLRRDHSEVLELDYPLRDAKFGAWPAGEPHPPSAPTWRYVADPPGDFLSYRVSNAQRLENGNTLIASGLQGTLFEVTPEGREVWRYVSPVVTGERLFKGDPVRHEVLGEGGFERTVWQNVVYRAFRYPPAYPGLEALDATPEERLAPRIESYLAPDKLAVDSALSGTGHYDVYADGHWFILVNDDCHADDATERLLAHATPVDGSVLGPDQSYLSLYARYPPLQEEGRCIARWTVPRFPISHVLAGQRDSARAMLWSGEIVFDRAAFEKTLAAMLAAAGEPVIESGMDVHVHGRRIFYVSDDCEGTDGRTPFFLHVVPMREADLPPERIEHGYDNLDFHQAGVTFGERCVVRWQLPDYPIRRIRTGQYVVVRDGEEVHVHNLWEGEAEIDG